MCHQCCPVLAWSCIVFILLFACTGIVLTDGVLIGGAPAIQRSIGGIFFSIAIRKSFLDFGMGHIGRY